VGQAHIESQPSGLAPARAVLANGVTVIAKETRTTPAVTLHANIRAGTDRDPADGEGLAHFLSRAIDRGTERYSADDIAEQFDRRGVTLSTTVGRHVLTLVCTCLVEDFEDVLGIVAEIVTRPTFPPLEVDRRRGEIITLIRQDADNPAAVAVETLNEMLYPGGHPYGRRVRGTIDRVERIDRDGLLRFHAAHCVPSGLSLAFVGDIEAVRAIDAARAAFDGWTGGAAVPATRPPAPAPGARRGRVVPMMNKSQADIAYGFVAIARSEPAYYAYWLMNNILGQYSLGGRLGDRIREQQGMAYYVFSSLEASLMPGPLVIRAGVSPSNVERAVHSIDAELARLAGEGPTEQETTESKQYLIGSLPRTLETNVGIASYLQSAEFFGLGLDYDVRVPGLLRAVTRGDVHEAARRAIDPAHATVVVAGPYEGSLA
jgi:zinc protease